MLYISRRGLKSAVDWYISWLIMTIDDVINAKKLDFITKVYRRGEYTPNIAEKSYILRVLSFDPVKLGL